MGQRDISPDKSCACYEKNFVTVGVPYASKVDAWRNALAEIYGPVEVSPSSREEFGGHVRYSVRGQLIFADTRYSRQNVERTPVNVAGMRREYFLLTQPIEDSTSWEQNGRVYTLERGSLYLLNPSVPTRMRIQSTYRGVSVSFPAAAVRLREPKAKDVYAASLTDGSPHGPLLQSYMKYLREGIAEWTDTEYAELSDRLLDLVFLLMIQGEKASLSDHDTPIKAAHRERAIAHINSRLSDPDLSVEKIAHGCGISSSYLRQVFHAADMKVECFIYTQRLEKCSQMLADPANRDVPISTLAGRVGFRHTPHFNRRFKERFGMSPKDYRADTNAARNAASVR